MIENRLNQNYRFDNFVKGECNSLAYEFAVSAAENYDPVNGCRNDSLSFLYIYGGTGLGKTHLLHAIGNRIKENRPELNVICVTGEGFTSEFIAALTDTENKDKRLCEFKSRYRNADVLLIDDIQFIEGKEMTQLELFNTLNALCSNNKQIVITGDRPPRKLRDLDPRIVSRLKTCVVEMTPNDFETRVNILREVAGKENIETDEPLEEVIRRLARDIQYDVRELKGAIEALIHISRFTKEKLDMNLARNYLTEIFRLKNHSVMPAVHSRILAFGLGGKQMEIIEDNFPECAVIDTTENFESLIEIDAAAAVINPDRLNTYLEDTLYKAWGGNQDFDFCIAYTKRVDYWPPFGYYPEENSETMECTIDAIKEHLSRPEKLRKSVKRSEEVLKNARDIIGQKDFMSMSSAAVHRNVSCRGYEDFNRLLQNIEKLDIPEKVPNRGVIYAVLSAMMLAFGIIDERDIKNPEWQSAPSKEWIVSLSEEIGREYKEALKRNNAL